MAHELDASRLDRSRPLREQIYDLVRQLILTGKIAPGDVLDEKSIAASLNVSRTPVREAVKKLSDEHLVDVVAQSGTRATHIDRAEVEQAFLIRRALEMESAAQAAQRMTEAHADALNDLLLQHARAIERRRFAEAIATDDRFHRYIADISNLDRLWRAIDISKAQLDRCRHVMLPRQGQGEATLEQHRNIIRALNSHDAERARRAMADHLEAAFSSTMRAHEAGEIKSR
ncbi:GntR family transcriptional regulator [Aestuariivirga sp.]|uniref:GntR family transcriptional regulator n=1 Tax=Aestuariivirga sp. TaxID=2650926 RepID=UPI0039E3F11B